MCLLMIVKGGCHGSLSCLLCSTLAFVSRRTSGGDIPLSLHRAGGGVPCSVPVMVRKALLSSTLGL